MENAWKQRRLQQRYLAALGRGLTPEKAVASINADPEILKAWREENKNTPTEDYTIFVIAEEAAKLALEIRLLDIVSHSEDWRAAAWLLERRFGYTKEAPLQPPSNIYVNIEPYKQKADIPGPTAPISGVV